MSEIDMAPCNECAKRTRHHVKAEYKTSGSEEVVRWQITHAILECGGCGMVSFRRRMWFSEWQDVGSEPVYQDSFFPPRLEKPEPTWFSDLPEELQVVLGETYDAFYNDQGYLCAVGIRTALDIAIVEKIGDAGTFHDKVDLLRMSGLIAEDEAAMLKAVLEAGHAAAHRGFRPLKADLEVMLEILETVLHTLFIRPSRATELHKSAEQVQRRVPPRSQKPTAAPDGDGEVD